MPKATSNKKNIFFGKILLKKRKTFQALAIAMAIGICVSLVYPRLVADLRQVNTTLILILGSAFSVLIAVLVGISRKNRQCKAVLINEQARLATIVENTTDGIISKDLAGIVTSWNHGAEVIFGYSPRDAVAKNIADLIVPGDLQHEEKKILNEIRKGETVPHFTTIRNRKDGNQIPVSIVVSPLRDAKGKVIGASTIIRDLTEQKSAEDCILKLNHNLEAQVAYRTLQLEHARRSLQTVLDAVPSMIGYWDKHLINRVANRAYHDWFGLDHYSIPGMHARELLGERLFAANKELMEAALRGEKQTFFREIPTPSGVRHSLAHYLPDINNGDVQGFYVIVHDITEITETNKRLSNALLENKALLNTINQQMLYTVTDADGNIIDANSNFCLATGYTYEELRGKNHRILNSGVHPPEFWETLWKKISTGESWHGEICNQTKNGELRWFDTVIARFIDVDEKTVRYISLRNDITNRKHAENERKRLTLLIDNVLIAASEVSIIATDSKGIITIFNRGAELMLGYNAEDVVGKSSPTLFHLNEEVVTRSAELTDLYHAPIEGFRVFVHQSELHGSETRNWTYIRKDGSRLQVSLVFTTMRNSTGHIIGYLSVGTDVTEELRNKRALKSTIEQFSIATDVAELGVWSWTFSDDSLDWNDRMFDIYSIPKEYRETGLSLKHWLARIHPDDAEALKSNIRAFINIDGVYDAILRLLDPDGKIHYIQIRAQIERDEVGRAIKATGVNRDVTNERELESRLRQAKESADAANEAKSAFLANMSHEIRTPMNAILGMLQLIQKTDLTTRQQDYLEKTFTAAKSLLWLLNDILDFSKIGSGKLELDYHSLELEPLMRDLAIILFGNQGDKDVEVIFDLDPMLPNSVIGDQHRLQQILINLAGNALKFTETGHILLSLKLISQSESHVRICISVSDTGIGISDEKIAHIFEGFVQAEASTTRRFGGTGLGLAISKHLVELMGGKLQVESKVGKGSRFWFEINFESPEPQQISLKDNFSLFCKYRILIIDDNALSREIISRIVSNFGAQVDEADGGISGVKRIFLANEQENPYDIVLLDWSMPAPNGQETLEFIQNLENLRKVPIIFLLTTFSHQNTLHYRHTETIEKVRYLNKPVTPRQLWDSLATATGLQPNITPQSIIQIQEQPLLGLDLLVVEDNPLNRHVALELLKSKGANVELAEGGCEGVKKVLDGEKNFHLVIMDMQMPDIDGLEATRRIRANDKFKSLPILAMTANVSPDDVQKCLAEGMNDHIGKPIDIDELVRKILALLDKSRCQSMSPKETTTSSDIDCITDNIQGIVKRFGGNAELYVRLLPNFRDEVERLLATIDEEIKRNDPAAIQVALHSIKGIAGSAGAKELVLKATEFEDVLTRTTNRFKHREVMRTYLTTMHQLFEANFRQLDVLTSQFPKSLKKDIPAAIIRTPDQWRLELADIVTLLERGNLSAISRLEVLYQNSPPSDEGLLAKALALASAMDFKNAAIVIDNLIGKAL